MKNENIFSSITTDMGLDDFKRLYFGYVIEAKDIDFELFGEVDTLISVGDILYGIADANTSQDITACEVYFIDFKSFKIKVNGVKILCSFYNSDIGVRFFKKKDMAEFIVRCFMMRDYLNAKKLVAELEQMLNSDIKIK